MINYLVIGAGRSGTSLLASLLANPHAETEIYRGDRLLPPSPDNPRGFYEDSSINHLNELIMRSVIRFTRWRWLHRCAPGRFAWPTNGWMALVPSSARLLTSERQQTAIRRLVQRQPYCLKDPRFSYTLPAWRPHLPPTRFLCIFRQPGAVCDSIQAFFSRRQIGYSRRFCYAVWCCHYDHILRHYGAGGDWLFVAYESLFSAAGQSQLESALGIAVRRDRIDANLNHSSTTTLSDDVPAECTALHDRLTELAI